eukprot:gnl/MRDRNA2_/MRDRNA2_279216_c0_seq1.p1 gnl/MRDRNA2_/MRDRNA2_279216_c0~~gnl/MRDRNA2_/MRDRNA2_279216_c0_seq1.p1  ORF type:complete len:130 (-),score=8.51 gnl/MRDRNA2_/MRDRNA2_279216_c0_seq1:27-416(-)
MMLFGMAHSLQSSSSYKTISQRLPFSQAQLAARKVTVLGDDRNLLSSKSCSASSQLDPFEKALIAVLYVIASGYNRSSTIATNKASAHCQQLPLPQALMAPLQLIVSSIIPDLHSANNDNASVHQNVKC